MESSDARERGARSRGFGFEMRSAMRGWSADGFSRVKVVLCVAVVSAVTLLYREGVTCRY